MMMNAMAAGVGGDTVVVQQTHPQPPLAAVNPNSGTLAVT